LRLKSPGGMGSRILALKVVREVVEKKNAGRGGDVFLGEG